MRPDCQGIRQERAQILGGAPVRSGPTIAAARSVAALLAVVLTASLQERARAQDLPDPAASRPSAKPAAPPRKTQAKSSVRPTLRSLGNNVAEASEPAPK